MSSTPFPLRWCLLRLRRVALLLVTISAILILSCAAFAFLNRGGAANAAKRLMDAAAASSNGGNNNEPRPAGRAMVQYYPDNQDKYLFRKDNIRRDAEVAPPKVMLAQKQRQKLKDALEIKDQEELDGLSDAPQPFNVR